MFVLTFGVLVDIAVLVIQTMRKRASDGNQQCVCANEVNENWEVSHHFIAVIFNPQTFGLKPGWLYRQWQTMLIETSLLHQNNHYFLTHNLLGRRAGFLYTHRIVICCTYNYIILFPFPAQPFKQFNVATLTKMYGTESLPLSGYWLLVRWGLNRMAKFCTWYFQMHAMPWRICVWCFHESFFPNSPLESSQLWFK